MGAQPHDQESQKLGSIVIGPHEIWRRALEQLRDTLPQASFEQWFASTRAIELRAGTLTVAAESAFHLEALMTNSYFPAAKAAASGAAGRAIDLKFVVQPKTAAAVNEPPPAIERPSDAPGDGEPPEEGQPARAMPVLRDGYQLDNFVVGRSNRFAHAAALVAARSPGKTDNPIFIYGGSGLGKTHLLQGIAHRTKSHLYTIYVDGEEFLRRFVHAIRGNRRADFQQHFESADILLFDDVHSIGSEAEGTQEALFHLFNALHQRGKQIVISSDEPPRRLQHLPHRLVTRFEWGLVVELEKPDLELRIAILAKKSAERGIPLNEQMLRYIAERTPDQVRTLEGALSLIRHKATTDGEPITLNLVRHALADSPQPDQPPAAPKPDAIIAAVCDLLRATPEALAGKRKDRRTSRARHIAMYLVRTHCDLTYKETAAHFGGRDHTTVLYGCQEIEKQLDAASDSGRPNDTQRAINEVRARLSL